MSATTPESTEPKHRQPADAAEENNRTEGASSSMLERETHGQILDQPAPDEDTSDLTSGLNQPASQHLGNEERVPGEENPDARS